MDEYMEIIKGKAIMNKDPATVVEGIHDLWIVGGGLGPGKPSKGFFADLGVLLGNHIPISKSSETHLGSSEPVENTYLATNSDLTSEEKELIWKFHKIYGHRHRTKVAKMLQHMKRFKGKLGKIEVELSSCQICNMRARANPRPKVALPRATDVNQVVSMDLKILENNDPMKKKYCGNYFL